MDNFELSFACRTADGSTVPRIRTIAASDPAWARCIGEAMRGELIAPGRWLDEFRGAVVAPTVGNRAAELSLGEPCFLGYTAVWLRVLHMLGLRPDEVKWVYSWRIGIPENPRGHGIPQRSACSEPEIVGFFLWPHPKEAPRAA